MGRRLHYVTSGVRWSGHNEEVTLLQKENNLTIGVGEKGAKRTLNGELPF